MEWIIALISTLSGTILGWALQFIRRKKLYISWFEIRPVYRDGIFNAYFDLNMHNSTQFTKAILRPRIVCYNEKDEVFEERVQEAGFYKNREEKEKAEEFRKDIDLIEIPAHGNKLQYCKIEFFDFQCEVHKSFFVYEDEKFKTRRLEIKWKNKENNNEEKEK